MSVDTTLLKVSSKYINSPTQDGDGIHLVGNTYGVIEDTTVSFTHIPLDKIDECIAVTQGSEAYVTHSFFEGAEKVCLIGCGESSFVPVEKDKAVVFYDCTFKDGARRMPEVQDGMVAILVECTIKNWCCPDRFTLDPKVNRGFGAWAHKGGKIIAFNCKFEQDSFWKGLSVMTCDLLGHLGQAYNDEGIFGLLNPNNWIPGVCRGLTSSSDGMVEAYNCTKNKWWIRIENNTVLPFVSLRHMLRIWVDTLGSRLRFKCKDVFNLD